MRGNVVFQNAEIDDLIIVRSDGSPIYNFSVVVDDAAMQITHNIRGEDHLPNSPKQVLLYQALGHAPPLFAHVPLVLGLDRSRLSKRHGATSVLSYRETGYLPQALNNYLVRLGWSHGDQEIFSHAELIEAFSLDALGSSAGVFNPEKLEWVNAQHLKRTPASEVGQLIKPFIAERGWTVPGEDAWLEAMVKTLQERAKTLVELVDSAAYYLTDDVSIDPKAAAKHLSKASPEAMRDLRAGLESVSPWTASAIQAAFESVLSRYQLSLGNLAQPVRVALTGGTVSPGIFEVAEVLGRDRTLARLDKALPLIGDAKQPAAAH